MKIAIIDNYDSFTFNLVQIISESHLCGYEVIQNDMEDISLLAGFDKILLSPGPGLPSDSGRLQEVIDVFSRDKPILGICLGHQAIVQAFGGRLKQLKQIFHGVATTVRILDGNDYLFQGIGSKIQAARYHSWVVDRISLPGQFSITAEDEEGNIMAIKHKRLNLRGLQFHPESFLTEFGKEIMMNWIRRTDRSRPVRTSRTDYP